MNGRLPSPITITDELVAAVVGRLDALYELLNDRLPATTGGQPAPGPEGATVQLDLTEPAKPGATNTAEASGVDGGDLALSEPAKPRKAARKAVKRTPAKE